MNDKAGSLIGNQDWSVLQSLYASMTDAQWRDLFRGTYKGCTIPGYMLEYDTPLAAWDPVTAAADRLGLHILSQMLSQTDSVGRIPLHMTLMCCTVLAVAAFVVERTPTHLLNLKDKFGSTPLDILKSRGSSKANTVEITALFQSALSGSVCVVLCRRAANVAGLRPTSSSLFTHTPPLSPLPPSTPPARFKTK